MTSSSLAESSSLGPPDSVSLPPPPLMTSLPGSAAQAVGVVAAVEAVVAEAAAQGVLAAVAGDGVVAGAGLDEVVAVGRRAIAADRGEGHAGPRGDAGERVVTADQVGSTAGGRAVVRRLAADLDDVRRPGRRSRRPGR